jgi:uncharacterized protein (TIGR00290 family)
LTKLKEQEGIEGIVTGDIAGAGCAIVHSSYYESMAKQLGLAFIMPNEGDTYEVLKEVVGTGLRPVLNCINTNFFGEEWLGKKLGVEELRELAKLNKKYGLSIAFEGGEAESFTLACPAFRKRLSVLKSTPHWTGSSGYLELDNVELT